MEVWKDVVGYSGCYRVSNLGRVMNSKTKNVLKPRLNKGYQVINLKKNGVLKTHFVHRLVAVAFIDNHESKTEINHIDENKLNNKVENLMWCTAKENSNWGTRNKRISETLKVQDRIYISRIRINRTSKKDKRICQIDIKTGEVICVFNSVTEASNYYGYHQGNISSCCTGKKRTSNGFKWAYYDETRNSLAAAF